MNFDCFYLCHMKKCVQSHKRKLWRDAVCVSSVFLCLKMFKNRLQSGLNLTFNNLIKFQVTLMQSIILKKLLKMLRESKYLIVSVIYLYVIIIVRIYNCFYIFSQPFSYCKTTLASNYDTCSSIASLRDIKRTWLARTKYAAA